MKKKYLMYVALSGLLALTACNDGRPAQQHAKDDAASIDITALTPQIAEGLVNKCSANGIDVGCATNQAKDFIKSYPSFKATIAEYSEQCTQSNGEKECSKEYTDTLTKALTDKLAGPVTDKATETLKGKEEAMKKFKETKEQAKEAIEDAQEKSKQAAQDAAALAKQKANDIKDSASEQTQDTSDKVKNAIDSAGEETKSMTQQAVDKAKDAADKAKQKAQDLTNKAVAEWNEATGKVKSSMSSDHSSSEAQKTQSDNQKSE